MNKDVDEECGDLERERDGDEDQDIDISDPALKSMREPGPIVAIPPVLCSLCV